MNSMAFCLALAGAMRWRMSLGVPKVRLSISSVLMPYTCIAVPVQVEGRWRAAGLKVAGRELGGAKGQAVMSSVLMPYTCTSVQQDTGGVVAGSW